MPGGGEPIGGSTVGCEGCGRPTAGAVIANADIGEASGLAASALHAGVYYTHNDSGDTPRFFAIDDEGKDHGTFNILGAQARDWEDMARGPCERAGSSCLYFADIGDNDSVRKSYTVYRVAEPKELGPGGHSVMKAEGFLFQYPDGAHNAETLLVHPQTGEVFVVTKSARGSQLYKFPMPLDTSKTATLTLVGDVTVPGLMPLVTGGDLSPAGDGVLLRTYTALWFYPIASGQSVGDALAQRPCEVPTTVEQQGEAVAYTRDGKGYRTLSEGGGKSLQMITCQ